MRARVSWMNEADDAILEYFQELETDTGHRIALPPTAVWYNLVEELGMLQSEHYFSPYERPFGYRSPSQRPTKNAATTGLPIEVSHISVAN